MKHFLVIISFACAVLCVAVSSLCAAEQSSVIFSHTELRIIPQDTSSASFTVQADLRPASVLADRNLFQMTPPPAGKALALMWEAEDPRRIDPFRLFAPVDMLLVSAEGVVEALVPSVVPSSLPEPVPVPATMRCLVLLPAGAAQAAKLKPGDRVEGALFTPKPVIEKAK